MDIKKFYICYKFQLNYNQLVTACEFMYPGHLKSWTKNNETAHFNLWRGISTQSCIEFKNGFNQKGVLMILSSFEKQFKITKKAEILSCNYTSIDDLTKHCIKNNLAIITSNDFLYPDGNKMVSINGNSIQGQVFLVSQSK